MKILILTWRDLTHPAAGGAEVYTEQVARRWVDQGHQVTLVAATVADRPPVEIIDGYRVVRLGNKYTVYREARKWWEREGQYEHFDVVLDMINTVAFRAHRWVKGVPTVGFAHQTCEEIWHINAPAPAALLGRYVLEPRWLKAYADIPWSVLGGKRSTGPKKVQHRGGTWGSGSRVSTPISSTTGSWHCNSIRIGTAGRSTRWGPRTRSQTPGPPRAIDGPIGAFGCYV